MATSTKSAKTLANKQVYFDCNATTPVLNVAAEAALQTMKTLYGNPSSTHWVGLQAKYILESSRKTAGQVLHVEPEQLIFTSGATEAIQTAVFSALQHLKQNAHPSRTKLLFGATEHKVVPQALRHWVKALGLELEVVELPVDHRGQVRPDVLQQEVPHAALVCTMAVNNESGVIQNLDAIEKILQEKNPHALWLVDCVQGLGKIDLRLNSRQIHYAAFSGHKLYAPKGIGLLYVRKGTPFTPLIVGGGQEMGLRSGTENLPGVAAFGAVLKQLLPTEAHSPFHSHSRLCEFRDRVLDALKKAFPKIEINTPLDCSVPTTINFSIPGVSSSELLDLFDSAGVRLSSGSACSASSAKPSHVLDAMGISHAASVSALRLSFGPCTLESEIDLGCQLVQEAASALKNTCLLDTAGGFEPPANLRDGLLQFRAGSTNSWLLADQNTRNCIIIDPCDIVADRIEHYVRCQNLHVLAILDTHSHADHESIRPVLQKILSGHFDGTQKPDSLGWPTSPSALKSVILENGDTVACIDFAPSGSATGDDRFVLAKVATPGHTVDSQTFLFGLAQAGKLKKENIRFVFSGDTVLSGGLGRTNFTVSEPESLFHSLRKLREITQGTTLLCPAHDYNNSFATSIATETASNPLLALALAPMTPLTLEQFLTQKAQIDQDLKSLEESFQEVVCGVTKSGARACEDSSVAFSASQLKKLGNKPRWIIDVREPQEFSLFKDWAAVGLTEAPRNVPLSRLTNFIYELTCSNEFDQTVLFLCRSGGRSLQAAKSLRRLGFKNAFSLEGGLAVAQCH